MPGQSFVLTISAKDKASGTLGQLKGAVKGLIGAYIGFQAVRQVIQFIGESITAFGKQEQSLKKLDAVLTSTGNKYGWTVDELSKMATEMQKVTALGDEEIMSAQALGLTFTDIGRDVFPGFIQASADMSQAMGTDMRSSVLQLGKALQDPDRGLGMLGKVGVNVAELRKQFTDSMPIQEKQALILKEIGTEFGGMAEAMGDTLQGRLKRMGNMFGDVKEQIGGAIVGTDAFKNLLTSLESKIGEMGKWLEENSEVVEEYATVVISAIQGIADGLFFLLKGAATFMSAWKELWGGEIKQNIKDQEMATQHALEMQKRYAEQLKKGIITKEQYRSKMEALYSQTQQYTTQVDKITIPTIQKHKKNVDELTLSEEELANAAEKAAEEFESQRKILDEMNEIFGERKMLLEFEAEAEKRATDEAVALLQVQMDLTKGMLEQGASIEEVANALGVSVGFVQVMQNELKGAQETGNDFFKSLRDNAINFGHQFLDNVVDAFVEGKMAWSQLVSQFMKDITKMIVKALLLKAIKSAFSVGTGGAGGFLSFLTGQTGGLVSGGAPYKDRIPALLSPGEFVMRREAVERVGVDNLMRMNRGDTFNSRFNFNITMGGGGGQTMAYEFVRIMENEFPRIYEMSLRKRKIGE